jgi:hypothetical protein
MTIGARNRYTCDTCTRHIITEDRDVGVTPFTLRCLATPNCKGTMRSSFYRGEEDGTPTYEWRKSTPEELVKASPAARDHYIQGGLEIYPIRNGDTP